MQGFLAFKPSLQIFQFLNCDAHRIIVLDHGEIAEEGTHAELIKKPLGRYARLYALQAG